MLEFRPYEYMLTPSDIKRFNDQKRINLCPDFQRASVWTKAQKCKLIEYMLLGLRIPPIYAFSKSSGAYRHENFIIIDGKQRLETIIDFLEGKLILENLEILTNLNGMNVEGVEANFDGFDFSFLGYQLPCYIVDSATPKELMLYIFESINRGGTPITNEELEHAKSVLSKRTNNE